MSDIEITPDGMRLTLQCQKCKAMRGIEGRLEGREFKAIIKSWLDAHEHKELEMQ